MEVLYPSEIVSRLKDIDKKYKEEYFESQKGIKNHD
jgi:hypothetical protein